MRCLFGIEFDGDGTIWISRLSPEKLGKTLNFKTYFYPTKIVFVR